MKTFVKRLLALAKIAAQIVLSKLVAAFPVNRVVVLLTPAATLGAAYGSGWLAEHFPGMPTPTSAQLLALELAGATSALSAALGWLRGHHILLAKGADSEANELEGPPPIRVTPIPPA